MEEKLIADIVKQILLNAQQPKAPNNQTPSSSNYQDPKEVGIGIGAAYGVKIHQTINGLPVNQVLKEIMAGIEEEGMTPKVYRIMRTSDVSFMGNDVAKLVGSGIGIGLQSKGTAVIHQKDLYPLTNLELFPQAPLLTLETYRKIGKNAAKYAKGEQVMPIPIQNDPMCRPKYQVKAALMHTIETELVVDRGEPVLVTTHV
ncbi:MAG: dehydratase medium subunit [Clostridia bacterium]|jgi:hypothetical protein|nr:dehydratase medium subunit [Clostridia bacterium]